MWSSWYLGRGSSTRILVDSLASKIHASFDLKSLALPRVSPFLLFLHVLQGMAGAIGVSNFFRAFLMVSLNSLSISRHHPMQFPHSNARLRRDFLTTQIHSSGLLASDSYPPCPGLSSTLSITASHKLSSYNLVMKPTETRIITLLTGVSHFSILAATHFSAPACVDYTSCIP